MNAWQDKVSRPMDAVVSVRLEAGDRVSVRRLPAGDQCVLEVALEVALDSHYTTESDHPQSPPPAMLQPPR